MATPGPSVVAEVGQAGDIVLLASMLAAAVVVGLAVLGLDALVAHLRRRRHRPPAPG